MEKGGENILVLFYDDGLVVKIWNGEQGGWGGDWQSGGGEDRKERKRDDGIWE